MVKMTLTKKQRKRIKELNRYFEVYKVYDLKTNLFLDGSFEKASHIGKTYTKYEDVKRFISQLPNKDEVVVIKIYSKLKNIDIG